MGSGGLEVFHDRDDLHTVNQPTFAQQETGTRGRFLSGIKSVDAFVGPSSSLSRSVVQLETHRVGGLL